MKAVYINLDPYLQAFANWINAGKSGDAPKFDPLPLSVTIPLGESAAIYLPDAGTSEGTQEGNSVTIDGVSLIFGVGSVPWESVIASEVVPGLSTLAPSAKYAVAPFAGGDVSVAIYDEDEYEYDITFTVLVRREQASGPVDLVDFTPPAAALTADAINTALGGTGAQEGSPLAGVSLGRANIVATNKDGATTFTVNDDGDPIIIKADSGTILGAALGADTAS